jgi:hypothetical protein
LLGVCDEVGPRRAAFRRRAWARVPRSSSDRPTPTSPSARSRDAGSRG